MTDMPIAPGAPIPPEMLGGNGKSQQPPLATARAGVMIEVVVKGQQMLFDIPTAVELANQLIQALQPYVEQPEPPKPKRKRQPRAKS